MSNLDKPSTSQVQKLLELTINRPDVDRIIDYCRKRQYIVSDAELPAWYWAGFGSPEECNNLIGGILEKTLAKFRISYESAKNDEEEQSTPSS